MTSNSTGSPLNEPLASSPQVNVPIGLVGDGVLGDSVGASDSQVMVTEYEPNMKSFWESKVNRYGSILADKVTVNESCAVSNVPVANVLMNGVKDVPVASNVTLAS